MSNYIITSDEISVIPDDAMSVRNMLPAGIYQLSIEPMQPIRLVPFGTFKLPEKLYGKTEAHAERIIRTFCNRQTSTGALFVGAKGSGKSLLARKIANTLMEEHGLPTIIIPFNTINSDIASFIEMIDTPCMILFDEIDKVEEREITDCLLGIFDGISNTRKLFVLTANDENRINDKFMNRPGRIYYRIRFGGVPGEAIEEYCREKLKNPNFAVEMQEVAMYIRDFSFDMMKAVVEECNRYGESPMEAVQYLNVSPDLAGYFSIEVRNAAGKIIEIENSQEHFAFYPDEGLGVRGFDPDKQAAAIRSMEADKRKEVNEDEYRRLGCVHLYFKTMDYKKMQGGELVYFVDGYTITCRPCKMPQFNSFDRFL